MTAIVSSGKVSNTIVKKINKSFLHIEKYFTKLKIQINEPKIQAINFPFNKSPKRIHSISLHFIPNLQIYKMCIRPIITLDAKYGQIAAPKHI